LQHVNLFILKKTGQSLAQQKDGWVIAGLSGGDFSRLFNPGLITKIKAADWRQIVFEFINERHPGRNVHLNDLFIGDPVKEFDQRSKTVPVRYNQNSFSVPDRWRNALVPVRQ
jgi:hypothetical protein